jgi:nucleoside-diphosphate-sugar epimerase
VGTTVLEFVGLLNQAYGREVPPVLRGEFRPGDFRHLTTDAGLLQGLGWQVQTSLREGLKRYAEWIQGYGSIEEYFSEAERLLKQTRVIQQRPVGPAN